MNQILFTSNDNNKNYNRIDLQKIIIIFSIAIIIVALIIIAIKTYGFYVERSGYAIPEITVTKLNDETKEVAIKAICEDGIQYIVYTWNEDQENRVNLNGSTSFERVIEIPGNTMNNLKVEVISMKGVSNYKTEIFENNIDTTKPIIDSLSIIDKKLNIQVSDDNGIKYLAYRWENEEEVKIMADENNNKKMTAQIDIQRGTYKLQVTVVDIYGNEETLSKLITGVNEPEISAIKYGGTVHISVTHDRGFKKIEFIINDKKYVYDENFSKYDKNKTTVEFDFPLKEGENIVQVNAYSQEKLSEEDNDELENYAFKRFTGKCTYEP